MNTSHCQWCGNEIVRKGSKPGRFCSLDCKASWQRTQKPVDESWLRQKYSVEGLSTYDIAALVGRNPKQVYSWLTGYGIETRPRGENLKGEDCYMKRAGAKNPFQGRRHSDDTRAKLAASASKPKPHIRGAKNGMYGRRGPAHPNYRDGSSPERQRIYSTSEWRALIKHVYARDNYACVRCGKKKLMRRSLHAHHIKPWAGNPALRMDANNLVTLCPACHRWVHSNANVNREYIE